MSYFREAFLKAKPIPEVRLVAGVGGTEDSLHNPEVISIFPDVDLLMPHVRCCPSSVSLKPRGGQGKGGQGERYGGPRDVGSPSPPGDLREPRTLSPGHSGRGKVLPPLRERPNLYLLILSNDDVALPLARQGIRVLIHLHPARQSHPKALPHPRSPEHSRTIPTALPDTLQSGEPHSTTPPR